MTDRIKKVRRARLGEITDFFAEEEIRSGDPVVCERTPKTVVFDEANRDFTVSRTKLTLHVSPIATHTVAASIQYMLLKKERKQVRRLVSLLKALAVVLCLGAGFEIVLLLAV